MYWFWFLENEVVNLAPVVAILLPDMNIIY
jgi:hypothetical protein